ncbi:hypothetical protein [Shewanella holmiensis]|uniref:Uncharacterized protein n=1 Tax=Shewanella holmiensis TaxID=2952222 RepID=A0A9X2WMR0_9GAMM|nr:hypothetical protein [Shewanella holmiensis]MCT7942264.1 hypothetical protein [Shewanella holmiensis]
MAKISADISSTEKFSEENKTTQSLYPPTAQANLDEPWCHVQETMNLLILAMAQIKLGLDDGDQKVASLGELFTDMASHQQQVNHYLATKNDTPQAIIDHGQQLAAKVNQGVMAFQFYDRLSQRLQHVVNGLGLTKEVLGDQDARHTRAAWQQVNQQIKNGYSLEEERALFDCILQGGTLAQALALYQQHLAKRQEDDIELF